MGSFCNFIIFDLWITIKHVFKSDVHEDGSGCLTRKGCEERNEGLPMHDINAKNSTSLVFFGSDI
jgi:hypothetical protein